MSAWILWLVFALAEGTLILSCLRTKTREIEAELRQKSLQALSAHNLELGEGFVMDGRDVWLFGSAPSAADKTAAAMAIGSVPGVRVVRNFLSAPDEPAVAAVLPETPASAPPPQPTPAPAPPVSPVPRAAAPAPESPPPAAKTAATTPPPSPGAADVQRSIDALVAGRVVEFESGRDRLTARGAALVDEIGALLARHPDARVRIAGHTDSQGTSRNNLTLSRKRAEAVRDRLVAAGIPAARLTAEGFGEDRPIASNANAAGRLRNRRVEFTVE